MAESGWFCRDIEVEEIHESDEYKRIKGELGNTELEVGKLYYYYEYEYGGSYPYYSYPLKVQLQSLSTRYKSYSHSSKTFIFVHLEDKGYTLIPINKLGLTKEDEEPLANLDDISQESIAIHLQKWKDDHGMDPNDSEARQEYLRLMQLKGTVRTIELLEKLVLDKQENE